MGYVEKIERMKELYKDIPRFRNLLNYDKLIERMSRQDGIMSLINKLDWSLSKDEQVSAIKILIDTIDEDDCDLLLIAGGKQTWHNSIIVLKDVGYPRNKKALPSLILLLQDINWPGASEGMALLKGVAPDVLIPLLEVAIEEGYNSCDFIWLAGIKHFLTIAQINKTDFINHDVYELLEYADW